ncbi:MAG: EutN/CcmL family microcompartment protein [Candidatus Zhuqueibacterota bacterium]
MKFARVIGHVIATRKEGNVQGLKLLVVRYLDEDLKATKQSAVCVDTVEAKPGDVVLLCSSSSARMTKRTRYVCTDNTTVAIVDSISSGKKTTFDGNA